MHQGVQVRQFAVDENGGLRVSVIDGMIGPEISHRNPAAIDAQSAAVRTTARIQVRHLARVGQTIVIQILKKEGMGASTAGLGGSHHLPRIVQRVCHARGSAGQGSDRSQMQSVEIEKKGDGLVAGGVAQKPDQLAVVVHIVRPAIGWVAEIGIESFSPTGTEGDHRMGLTAISRGVGDGVGVPKDYGDAVRWYRKAAEQGLAAAQFNLGTMYGDGQGVPQDHGEAARWYRKAADQGDANGQHNLGGSYVHGRGVPQDYGEAVRWYRRAADQGHAGAQCNLGQRYSNGQGVPKDCAEAVVSQSRRSGGCSRTAQPRLHVRIWPGDTAGLCGSRSLVS